MYARAPHHFYIILYNYMYLAGDGNTNNFGVVNKYMRMTTLTVCVWVLKSGGWKTPVYARLVVMDVFFFLFRCPITSV